MDREPLRSWKTESPYLGVAGHFLMTNPLKNWSSFAWRNLAFEPFEDALSGGFGCSDTFLQRFDGLFVGFDLFCGHQSCFPRCGWWPLVDFHVRALSSTHTILITAFLPATANANGLQQNVKHTLLRTVRRLLLLILIRAAAHFPVGTYIPGRPMRLAARISAKLHVRSPICNPRPVAKSQYSRSS